MSKNVHIDLKIGISFAISTGTFLILGLYILLSIQPIIDQFKITILETSDAISITTRLLITIKEASINFRSYTVRADQSFYDNFTKNIHLFNTALEHAQNLNDDSISLKILNKNLPQVIALKKEYKEVGQKVYDLTEMFKQNTPKLAFLLSAFINDIEEFLKTLEELVRNTGGKDAEAFKLIVDLNQLIETSLLARGDFWRGVSNANSNAFETCLKILKGSISHMEAIKEANSVKEFTAPFESLIFSMKNLENIFVTIINNYELAQENIQNQDAIVQSILTLLNEILEENMDKIGIESKSAVENLKLIRNIVLMLVAIGVIFTNTVGFIVAKKIGEKTYTPSK
ncbi:hypothetical protein BW722_03030 [Lawsonia intracellularis]|uniref:hypothetical protein n=1 Tax=Lawsonia intracellularis TaxID=29546 RepID=UPI000975FA76|nr:hypothetical protein [Lawsonia intracellularis]OMQ04416.1 hypothetical protein BW722_03030 [Lawsonia intracellularis]